MGRRWLLVAAGGLLVLLMGLWVAVFPAGGGSTTADSPTSTQASAALAATHTPGSGLPTVTAGKLPAEARQVLTQIDHGGPFRYSQDGTVFGNFEGRLPKRPSGYYHEYTVPTPGERDRGARRLIAGRNGDLYYTDDHYDTFRQVLR
jgi:ribonuclease T1